MGVLHYMAETIRRQRLNAGSSGPLACIAACHAFLLAAGCSKNEVPAPARTFGGPAEVTLILSGGSSTKGGQDSTGSLTKAGAVDESSPVRSIRIYAFKHAPEDPVQNNELVGYIMYSGFEGSGPHYCRMGLTASGDIDFYVIANDLYAVTGAQLDEGSTREEIERFRFSGLYEHEGQSAVPMSNIMTGDSEAIGSNNFSFHIDENDPSTPVIPIQVSRAMARLSLFLLNASDEGTASLTSATVYQGPDEAGLFSADGAPAYGGTAPSDRFVSTEHTLKGVTGVLQDEDYEMIGEEAYILPNTSGSLDADEFIPEGNSQETRAYIVSLTFMVNGSERQEEVYLPSVSPNDWIRIYGAVSSRIDVNLKVLVDSWDIHEIDIPPFM